MLVWLCVALWFILRGDLLYGLPCVILLLCFFSPFSIAITSLWEEIANLSAFRTFVPFVLVLICRFPLPLAVWEGLRFVIVALPGLFSYLFFLFLFSCFVKWPVFYGISMSIYVCRNYLTYWVWSSYILTDCSQYFCFRIVNMKKFTGNSFNRGFKNYISIQPYCMLK